uniref:Putative glycine rich cell wall structural protein n=1 Tax=Rhipicephalus microplus TaxID=6941 RepID=A0A6G5AIW7_RHIMP
MAQEPFRPEQVTEKSKQPEPFRQIVQEPYRPEDIEEPTQVRPAGQIAQEPLRPEDVTENQCVLNYSAKLRKNPTDLKMLKSRHQRNQQVQSPRNHTDQKN